MNTSRPVRDIMSTDLVTISPNTTTKEIKAIDFFNNQTNIINLKKDNTFDNFIKIDLLKEIQKINFETAEVYRFWGESCGGSWTLPTGESYRTCCYYVFWINTGCEIEVTAK